MVSYKILLRRRAEAKNNFSYSKALETHPSPEVLVIAQLNRALSLLKSYSFDAALGDVEDVLQVSEMSEKALFRKAQALYQL